MKEFFNDPMKNFKTSFPDFLKSGAHLTVQDLDIHNDSDFDICLKLINLTLQQKLSTERESIASDKRAANRMRSFVFALCPNVGQELKRDESLNTADLRSLINRCSLYLVLYCGAPEGCKPRLLQIKDLAVLATSHRLVWDAMLGTWTRLANYHIMSNVD